MAVKTLDKHIKEAFTNLGFSEDEIKQGCWLLTRDNRKTGEKDIPVAWIALHKFLERVAQKANILFDMPQVLNCQPDEVAIYVNGSIIGGGVNGATEITQTAWSIGEASIKNCRNDYRWAMAEKRAKDRVILKLLGIAGDMYSEEEAEEFKKKPEEVEEFQKEAKAEKSAKTRALNKAVKTGEYEEPKPKMDLETRYENAKKWLEGLEKDGFIQANPSAIDAVNRLIADLGDANEEEKKKEIQTLVVRKSDIDDEIVY